ncbi:uracil-DNA glycosylase [Bacillaceae bacterium S4-13-56]
MEFPKELIDLVKRRIEPYDVEGFVLGGGNSQADLMMIGEAPGENEVIEGKPFIGRAGKELDGYFQAIGIPREEAYVTSVVRSRPYKVVTTQKRGIPHTRKANRKPNKLEIFAHAPILDYQIERIQPKIIVALGGVALQRLIGGSGKISECHGEPIVSSIQKLKNLEENTWVWSEKEYVIFPMYHPAAVFYNPKVRSEIEADLSKMKKYIENFQ